MDWFYRWRYACIDNVQKIMRHKVWLTLLVFVFLLLLTLNFSQGELKPPSTWAWVDIIGEGASSLCVVIWLLLVLSMRPAGQVTNWFAAGFIGIFASNFQDFLDEWVHLPLPYTWDSWVESLPIGLLALTIAFCLWRKEQGQIDRYLLKRQAIYHNTTTLDHTTSLPKFEHLNAQLEYAFAKEKANWQQHALVLIDIAPFSEISYRYGGREADRFLVVMSELMLLALREEDVLCHLAGDRFAIVIKNVDQTLAQQKADRLKAFIDQFYFPIKNSEHGVSAHAMMVLVMADNSMKAPDSLLKQAILALSNQHKLVQSNTFG